MSDNKISVWQSVVSSFLAVVGIIIIIIFLNKYTDLFKQQPTTQPTQSYQATPSSVPISQYPKYDIIKGGSPDPAFKIFRLIDESKINPVSARVDKDGIHGFMETKGKFDTAFLYIQAFVDYQNQFTPYDDFYFLLNESNANTIGGHISPQNSEPVPQNTGIKATQLLLDLSSVLYHDLNDLNNIKTAYWIFELNKNKKLEWYAFVSTDRPGGTIQEASIYYKCSKETPDCSIVKIQ